MTQKALKEMMERLYTAEDMEAYQMLWDAVVTLNNLGLIDDKIRKAMWEKDHALYEEKVVND